jgi:putative transposase
MANHKYNETQIHGILKESEAGSKTLELCRKYGITEQTFYRWKKKYGGMELSDIKRLKTLEDENTKLKKKVAEQLLEIDAIKFLLEKKF